MPRACSASPWRGSRSWSLAAPTTAAARRRGMVSSFRMPPAALGEKTSAAHVVDRVRGHRGRAELGHRAVDADGVGVADGEARARLGQEAREPHAHLARRPAARRGASSSRGPGPARRRSMPANTPRAASAAVSWRGAGGRVADVFGQPRPSPPRRAGRCPCRSRSGTARRGGPPPWRTRPSSARLLSRPGSPKITALPPPYGISASAAL